MKKMHFLGYFSVRSIYMHDICNRHLRKKVQSMNGVNLILDVILVSLYIKHNNRNRF